MMTISPPQPERAARPVPEPTGAAAHADTERRVRQIRRIIISWFCTCLLAIVLLSLTVDPDAIGPSARFSEAGHDLGSTALSTFHRTG